MLRSDVTNILGRERAFAQARVEDLPSAAPRRHEREDDRRDEQREPAAVGDLEEVRAEEGQVADQERRGDRARP